MRPTRTGLIGLVTGAISGDPAAGGPAGLPDLQIVHGIQRVLAESGSTLLISDTGGDAGRIDAPPTVLCCGNDRLAVTVYGLLRARGIALPEQMSVAGYDDYRVISETLYPQLTTMDLPYGRMGEADRSDGDL